MNYVKNFHPSSRPIVGLKFLMAIVSAILLYMLFGILICSFNVENEFLLSLVYDCDFTKKYGVGYLMLLFVYGAGFVSFLYFKLKDKLYLSAMSLPVISLSETHISFPIVLNASISLSDISSLSLKKEEGENIIELTTKTNSPLEFKYLYQKGFQKINDNSFVWSLPDLKAFDKELKEAVDKLRIKIG